jgi:hypothetical protein
MSNLSIDTSNIKGKASTWVTAVVMIITFIYYFTTEKNSIEARIKSIEEKQMTNSLYMNSLSCKIENLNSDLVVIKISNATILEKIDNIEQKLNK